MTHFQVVGIPCFGPSPKAAMMEGSKTFSKDFMKKHNIPTAAYENFTDYAKAKAYLESINHRVVLKASGLAAGKGVLIPTTKEESLAGLKSIMDDKEFGDAGNEVVIEEYLEGQELSVLAFSDGYTVIPLPPLQDHKRAYDGDEGPNTGGMGVYAPTPISTPELMETVKRTILQPTIDGMRHDGYPFVGMLFTGLMLTASGPKVLEYNVRFGDPETEVALPLLGDDSDLAEIMLVSNLLGFHGNNFIHFSCIRLVLKVDWMPLLSPASRLMVPPSLLLLEDILVAIPRARKSLLVSSPRTLWCSMLVLL